MAISTQTEALIELYNQKISLDTQQLSQLTTIQSGYTIQTGTGTTETIRIWGPEEVIDNYDIPIKKLDNKILEYNVQIVELEQQVLSIGQTANSVGCGSTAFSPFWFLLYPPTTVYEDQLRYKGYSFTAPNPFSATNGTLNTGNLGIGTHNYINPVAIGSYFGPVDTCNSFECNSGICLGYATSISNLNAQIVSLQALRDPLIEKVNILKESRSAFELQVYAYTQSENKLNEQVQKTQEIISFLEDPANEEWL